MNIQHKKIFEYLNAKKKTQKNQANGNVCYIFKRIPLRVGVRISHIKIDTRAKKKTTTQKENVIKTNLTRHTREQLKISEHLKGENSCVMRIR